MRNKIVYALLFSLLLSVFHDISLYTINSYGAQRIDTFNSNKQATPQSLSKEHIIAQMHTLFHTAALLPQQSVVFGIVPLCQLDFQLESPYPFLLYKVIVKPPIRSL